MEQNEATNGMGVGPERDHAVDYQSTENSAQEQPSMEMLLEEEGGLSLDLPKQGEVRTGVIATIRDNEILVSVGTKSEGVISGRELEAIPKEERESLQVGQEVPVFVVVPEDQNGNIVLSYTRAREERDWMDAEQYLQDGTVFDSKIVGYNKGGLIVPLGNLRGFVPASQISLLRRSSISGDTPEQKWSRMVGEPVKVRVIEVDRERRRLILSERQALQETRESLKDRLLDELTEGDVRTGRVTSVAEFGAFVNIDGADGLVHLSEISWERIQHPSEVLKVGQEVQVKVISVDHERKRIGLSIRQLQKDPWIQKVEGLREGQLIEGQITHLTKFGAFARLDEDLEGLIHVSELSEQRINHPKEVVKEGDQVTLRVIKVDPERRRIGLSLRKVASAAYQDLDWKMELAGEVSETKDEAPEEAQPAEAQPVEAQPAEAQLEETAEAEAVEEEPVAAEAVQEEVVEAEPAQEEPVQMEQDEPAAEAPSEEEEAETDAEPSEPEEE